MKNIVENEAREEEEETRKQTDDNIDLTATENERALKGAYRNFLILGTPKVDIDSYIDKAKPHITTLIEDQLKEMQSSKVIMTLWVRWKKPVKLAIKSDPEHVEGAQDLGGNTGDNYVRVEMLFNSLMTEFFEGSNTDELIRRMFAHFKV